MNKKYKIQVRKYRAGQTKHGSPEIGKITSDKGEFDLVEIISRVVHAEQIGNFNPLFCRYNGNKRVLVHSDDGDLSDPFRRTVEYGTTFFIEVKA